MTSTEFEMKMVAYDKDVKKAVKKHDLWTSDELIRARKMAEEMIRSGEEILKY